MAATEDAEPRGSRARPGQGESLEGWVPVLGPDLTLAEVVELAFDYRGDTTVVKVDGTRVVGYVFNREATVDQPFIQMFDEAGNGPLTVAYAEIANIVFTGRDTAAGSSWKAWLKRKAEERAAGLHPDPDRS
jgi:hypothetical protein